LPPGNSQRRPRCLWAGRWAMRMRPEPSSMTAQTTGMGARSAGEMGSEGDGDGRDEEVPTEHTEYTERGSEKKERGLGLRAHSRRGIFFNHETYERHESRPRKVPRESCEMGKALERGATFRAPVGFGSMKTFLKVVLILIAAVIVVKLLPALVLVGGLSLGGLMLVGLGLLAVGGVLGALGLSVAAALLVVALVVAVALSPVWVPVLVVVGIVAFVRKLSRRTATA
jgi:hypothetical protein